MEWYHVCWARLTAKRVEPVVSISWASCLSGWDYISDSIRRNFKQICFIYMYVMYSGFCGQLNINSKWSLHVWLRFSTHKACVPLWLFCSCFQFFICFITLSLLPGHTVHIHRHRWHVHLSQYNSSAVQPVGRLSVHSLLIQCHLPTSAVWTICGESTANVCCHGYRFLSSTP